MSGFFGAGASGGTSFGDLIYSNHASRLPNTAHSCDNACIRANNTLSMGIKFKVGTGTTITASGYLENPGSEYAEITEVGIK